MTIIVDLEVELARRKMSVGEFADAAGITVANITVLKNGRAKAVCFTTLDAICRVLNASQATSCAGSRTKYCPMDRNFSVEPHRVMSDA